MVLSWACGDRLFLGTQTSLLKHQRKILRLRVHHHGDPVFISIHTCYHSWHRHIYTYEDNHYGHHHECSCGVDKFNI